MWSIPHTTRRGRGILAEMESPPRWFRSAQVPPDVAPLHAVEHIAAALADFQPTLLLFFSGNVAEFAELAKQISDRWPETCTIGCTTSGEIGPSGLQLGGISVMALAKPSRVSAALVDELDALAFDEAVSITEHLCSRLRRTPRNLDAERHCFLTLTDGLSNADQLLLAAMSMTAPGIPMVGGAAADDLQFERTLVALDGLVRASAAVVVLLEPGVPFRHFQLHHFTPTERRVVVTKMDADDSRVVELDGWRAEDVFQELYPVTEADMKVYGPQSEVCLWPLGMQLRDDLVLRTMFADPRGGLRILGSLESGSVLRQMRRGSLLEVTQQRLEAVLDDFGPAAGCLLFDCAGRRIEAEDADQRHALGEFYRKAGGAGFVTYAEHFDGQVLNLTLTGLVFGHPDA